MISPEYFIHVVKSFGIHIFFGVVVVLSFNFSGPEEKPEKVEELAIDAVVIDQTSLEKQVNEFKRQEAAKKAAEEKRVRDLERRAAEAKKNLSSLNKQKQQSEKDALAAKRKAQQEKVKAEQAKKERLKREQEAAKAKKAAATAKKKKEAEEKAAKLAKQKKEAEQAALKKAEAERKRKAEEERKRIEKEKAEKARKEREAKERAAQEKLMQEQMAQEQAVRRKARQKVVMTEVGKYRALIYAKLSQNIIVDETMKNKSCLVQIKLASSGLVLSVKTSSGDPHTCKAAERGAWKVQTLPVSKDPEVFNEIKDINLKFIPEL